MARELSLKDLKALLDGNYLDLSMRDLVSIPVKDLSRMVRATYLDFSNNLIVSIPADFCLLTHITKLDLSNNRIVHLPEQFGKLINLVHLDLYKNEIKELPLSFGGLVSLKWLDLKGNPLELELSEAAGDCCDEKGCKAAASNVIQLMRDRSPKQQRLLDEQKSTRKQLIDNDVSSHELAIQKKKKRKKNKHRDAIFEHMEPTVEYIQETESRIVSEKSGEGNHGTKRNKKRSSNSVITCVWRTLIALFALSLAMSVVAIVMVLIGCADDPRHWSLSSKPFCKDLQTLVVEHSLPSTISSNLFLSTTSVLRSYADAANVAWKELGQHNELIVSVKDYCHILSMKLISVGLLVQGYAMYKYEDLVACYNTYVADTVSNAVKNVCLLLRIFGLVVADLLIFIVDKGLFFISSVVETIFTYADRGNQLAEML